MKKTSLSLILVFVVSILAGIGVYLYRVELVDKPLTKAAILVGYMWIPGIFALIFTYLEKTPLPVLRKPGRVFFTVPIVGLATCALAFFLSLPIGTLLKPNPLFASHSTLEGLGLLGGLIAATYAASLTTNMLAALGEELYWRGYLLEKLKKWGIFKAMGIIGVLWGLWHVPLIVLIGHNYPNHPWMGSGMMLLLCLAMTPLLTYYRFKGKSILVPSALHGTFNAAAGFSYLFFFDPNPFLVGITGVAGVVALLAVSAGLNLFSRKTWKKVLV